jgi:hypothetical protein
VSPRIVWTYPALAVFYDLRVHQATAVDRAVIRFAESGEGRVYEAARGRLRLRAGDFDVVLRFDADEGVLRVLHIYRVRP